MVVGEERWSYPERKVMSGGVHAAFSGAGCGRRVRRFHAVGLRVVGAGAWGV